jgi:hypothetical protein
MNREFSYRELQKCAEREVALRRNVFRKRGITPERQEEIVKMEAIATYFKSLADDDELAGRNPDGQMFVEGKRGASHYAPLYEKKPGAQ